MRKGRVSAKSDGVLIPLKCAEWVFCPSSTSGEGQRFAKIH